MYFLGNHHIIKSTHLKLIPTLLCLNSFPDVYILFLSEDNVVISLGKGRHTLKAPYRFDCGLIPLGGRCDKITTKNLKWDVDGPLQYGVLISSSNEMLSKTIEVSIENGQVLWLFDLKRVHKDD